MAVSWPDEIDEIIGGDSAAAFTYLTPAKGAVIVPMAPLGMRDREAGTLSVTTSQGLWKKLERVRANPSVAIAFHAREHGDSERPEFVLAQGTASFATTPDREWLDSITPAWNHFLGPRSTGLMGRWQSVYYWDRVAIDVEVRRLIVWPDLECRGEPRVIGEPLPAPPPPQRSPGNGTGPRVDAARLAKESSKLPHTLLGWAGGDGLPMVVAARAGATGDEGVAIDVAPGLLPDGGRRAGLTAHAFKPRMIGQEQRMYTGWLDVSGERAIYAPHTRTGSKVPESKLLFTVGAGAVTRMGIGKARERGLAT